MLLHAARDLFAEHGYHAVTTQDVARAAGVSETLIFRYFRSKAGLFSLAVLAPAMQVMEGFVASWTESGGEQGRSNTELVEQFVSDFFDVVSANRSLLVTVLHILSGDDQLDGGEIRAAVTAMFVGVERVIEAFAAERGVRLVDAPVTARSVLLFVGSTAMLFPYSFGAQEDRPSDARVKAELTAMMLRGIEPAHSD